MGLATKLSARERPTRHLRQKFSGRKKFRNRQNHGTEQHRFLVSPFPVQTTPSHAFNQVQDQAGFCSIDCPEVMRGGVEESHKPTSPFVLSAVPLCFRSEEVDRKDENSNVVRMCVLCFSDTVWYYSGLYPVFPPLCHELRSFVLPATCKAC